MNFLAHMADGQAHRVSAEDPRSAFSTAQKNWGIGTYVSKLVCSETSEVYYEKGNFIDPVKTAKVFLDESDTVFNSALSVFHPRSLNSMRSLLIDGKYFYYQASQATDFGTYRLSIYHYPSKKHLKDYDISISVVEDIPQVHKFNKMNCIHCGQNIFDVEDPTGLCEKQ